MQLSEDAGADPESDPSFASSSRSAEHLTNFSSLAPYFDIQQIDSDGKVIYLVEGLEYHAWEYSHLDSAISSILIRMHCTILASLVVHFSIVVYLCIDNAFIF